MLASSSKVPSVAVSLTGLPVCPLRLQQPVPGQGREPSCAACPSEQLPSFCSTSLFFNKFSSLFMVR
jgi:hypothetical protein